MPSNIVPFFVCVFGRFLSKLLFMLPSLHGEFRCQCLEVIQGRVEHMKDAYLELQSKGLLTFLTHRYSATCLILR